MTVFNKMLGIEIFTEDGKQDREIETRCQKSNNVTFLIGPRLSHPAVKTIIGTTFTPTPEDVDNHQENWKKDKHM